MPAIEIIDKDKNGEIFTARTYLDYLRKSEEHWWKDSDNSIECPWVFRGHWDSDWKLLPTAARAQFEGVPEFKKVYDKLKTETAVKYSDWNNLHRFNVDDGLPQDQWNIRIKDRLLREWSHMICVERFIKLARELNFDVEEPPNLSLGLHGWIESRKVMSDDLEVYSSINYNGGFDFYKSPSVALAQHHGIPTFLLDWTENPMTAIYFASNKPEGIEPKNGMAVWCINTSILDIDIPEDILEHTLGINKLHLIKPKKSGNKYLSSQSGILTYLKSPTKLWLNNGEFPDLETIFKSYENPKIPNIIDSHNQFTSRTPWEKSRTDKLKEYFSKDRTYLKKVILPSSQVDELKRILMREGISKAHMMPSLDNIANTSVSSLLF